MRRSAVVAAAFLIYVAASAMFFIHSTETHSLDVGVEVVNYSVNGSKVTGLTVRLENRMERGFTPLIGYVQRSTQLSFFRTRESFLSPGEEELYHLEPKQFRFAPVVSRSMLMVVLENGTQNREKKEVRLNPQPSVKREVVKFNGLRHEWELDRERGNASVYYNSSSFTLRLDPVSGEVCGVHLQTRVIPTRYVFNVTPISVPEGGDHLGFTFYTRGLLAEIYLADVNSSSVDSTRFEAFFHYRKTVPAEPGEPLTVVLDLPAIFRRAGMNPVPGTLQFNARKDNCTGKDLAASLNSISGKPVL